MGRITAASSAGRPLAVNGSGVGVTAGVVDVEVVGLARGFSCEVHPDRAREPATTAVRAIRPARRTGRRTGIPDKAAAGSRLSLIAPPYPAAPPDARHARGPDTRRAGCSRTRPLVLPLSCRRQSGVTR